MTNKDSAARGAAMGEGTDSPTARETQAGSAYSPLPWHQVFVGEEDDWGIGCAGKAGPVVAQMVWKEDAEFICRCVNAHEDLIAALLGVCSTARASRCWCDFSHDASEYGHQAKCAAARIAIAKAEGK